MKSLRPCTLEELAPFEGLRHFEDGSIPVTDIVVVDGNDCAILIGGNGVIICTEDGSYQKSYQTGDGRNRPKDEIFWWLCDELAKVYHLEDKEYKSEYLLDSSWEFHPAD